jgi:hypothetical protein
VPHKGTKNEQSQLEAAMFYPEVMISPIGRRYQLYRCDFPGCGRTSAVPANSGIQPRQWEFKDDKHFCNMRSCIHKRRMGSDAVALPNLVAVSEKKMVDKNIGTVKITELLADKVYKYTCFRCGAGSDTGSDWSLVNGHLHFCAKRACRDYAATHNNYRMLRMTERSAGLVKYFAAMMLIISSVACAPVAGEPATVQQPPPSTTPITIAVSPKSATVDACSGSYQFGTIFTGTTDTRVIWGVQEIGGGTITSQGVYVPPSGVVTGTYHVVATSFADITKTSVATVTVREGVVRVTVSPSAVNLQPGGTQQFTATVTTTCGGTTTSSLNMMMTDTGKLVEVKL